MCRFHFWSDSKSENRFFKNTSRLRVPMGFLIADSESTQKVGSMRSFLPSWYFLVEVIRRSCFCSKNRILLFVNSKIGFAMNRPQIRKIQGRKHIPSRVILFFWNDVPHPLNTGTTLWCDWFLSYLFIKLMTYWKAVWTCCLERACFKLLLVEVCALSVLRWKCCGSSYSQMCGKHTVRYRMMTKNTCHFCTTRTFWCVEWKTWFYHQNEGQDQYCLLRHAKMPKNTLFAVFLLKIRKVRFRTAQRPFVEFSHSD